MPNKTVFFIAFPECSSWSLLALYEKLQLSFLFGFSCARFSSFGLATWVLDFLMWACWLLSPTPLPLDLIQLGWFLLLPLLPAMSSLLLFPKYLWLRVSVRFCMLCVTHFWTAPLGFSLCDIFFFMNFDRLAEIMGFVFWVLDVVSDLVLMCS